MSDAIQEPLDRSFAEVVDMIRDARCNTYQMVNTALVELYWRVGEYLSRKASEAGWGKGVVT